MAGEVAAFWNYAVSLYGRPGVKELCLDLQDERGADVNILLFCCYLAISRRRALSETDCRRFVEATEDWREGVVRPLRMVRRRVKAFAQERTAFQSVYRSLKEAELDAERAQHGLLAKAADELGKAASEGGEGAALALNNMIAYMAVVGAPSDEGVDEALTRIAAAAAG